MSLDDRVYMRSFSCSDASLRTIARGARRNLASTITAIALAAAAVYSFIANNPNAELRALLVREHGETQADEIIANMTPEQRQMMVEIAKFAQQFQQLPGGR